MGSREIARYPFLALIEHDVVDPGEAAPRTVLTVELRDWAVAAARSKDGRWIMVEQHRHGIDAISLEPAGGIVDAGEAPASAAARELVEETGYVGGPPRALGVVHPNAALSGNRCHFFLIDGAEAARAPEQRPDEQTRVVLLDDAALERALADGTISHALAQLCLLRAREASGFDRALAELARAESLQRAKVAALAARLRPGLSADDLKSPHDFPELDDPDWHFEDGVLAGLSAATFALRGIAR